MVPMGWEGIDILTWLGFIVLVVIAISSITVVVVVVVVALVSLELTIGILPHIRSERSFFVHVIF